MRNLFYTEQKGEWGILFLICIETGTQIFSSLQLHRSRAQIFFSALQGDQMTTSKRPGRGLFSLGEFQTGRGRSVGPP
jgi:hypothetical protein